MLLPESARPDPPSPLLPASGRLLVAANRLDGLAAAQVWQLAQARGVGFLIELTDSGKLTSSVIAQTLSSAFSLPFLDLDTVQADLLPQGVLAPAICRTHRLIVLNKQANRLTIGIDDVPDPSCAEYIRAQAKMAVDWVIVECDKLSRFLASSPQPSRLPETRMADLFQFGAGDLDIPAVGLGVVDANRAQIEDAPVVRFLQKMLTDAYRMGASDLHFEPYETGYRVRFRIDGELREMSSPPLAVKDRLASRIKILSRLDISEKRIPQDGRMRLKVGSERMIDFRVSTLPTLFGEKIVVRVLDPGSIRFGIDALGYEPDEKARLLQAVRRPYGMVLVTGPTGSGKTVSLYTCLNLLNQPGVNISTAEDPSEINLPGINQVNVNEKAGLTFAVALRAFLRQDPDVIMVGEIRDLETADMSIKAAQTGHLVLSTLHTNDAPTTLTRLRNMGVAPFNIASSVVLITAQRLVRRLCSHCKAVAELSRDTLLQAGFDAGDFDSPWQPYRAVGCPRCHLGYQGRVGVYQVMPVTEAIQHIILRDGSATEIAAQAAREGVRSLRQSGLHKVRLGLTSLEEIVNCTNE
jgi:type IV pilus assembly protein PilB